MDEDGNPIEGQVKRPKKSTGAKRELFCPDLREQVGFGVQFRSEEYLEESLNNHFATNNLKSIHEHLQCAIFTDLQIDDIMAL